MSKRKQKSTIFIDRQGGIIYGEFILCSLLIAIVSVKLFDWPWSVGVIIFIPMVFLLAYLFFKVTVWRWLFSTLISLAWGYIAFRLISIIGDIPIKIDNYIVGGGIFAFMLWVHRDEYKFESNATVNYFDYRD